MAKTMSYVLSILFSASLFAATAIPGEFIVKLKSGENEILMDKSDSVVVKDEINFMSEKFVVLKTTNDNLITSTDVKSIIDNAEYVEPNFLYYADEVRSWYNDSLFDIFKEQDKIPFDPYFSRLWGLVNMGDDGVQGVDIDALRGWEISEGSKDIVVAVIDSGIDYNHEDLKENIWVNESEYNGLQGVDDDGNGFIDDIYGYDFNNDDGDPMDDHGHGTHCAGTIGAVHNDIGVSGVMKHVRLMGVKFLGKDGSGTTEQAIKSIEYSVKMGANVLSNSWGGGGFSKALYDAIDFARRENVVFIAASGNSSSNNDLTPHYPSSYELDNVISVAAHDSSDQLAYFSNYGVKSVDIVAPGVEIFSTIPGDEYESKSGTSMAAPHVSGVAGLVLAIDPSMQVSELKRRLLENAYPSYLYRTTIATGKRLNAYHSLIDEPALYDGPDDDDWVDYPLATPFESLHPYNSMEISSKKFHVEGAKYIRVFFSKVETEKNYDYILVGNGSVNVEKIDGEKENYTSNFVKGDTVIIKFSSDSYKEMWGFEVSKLQVIY